MLYRNKNMPSMVIEAKPMYLGEKQFCYQIVDEAGMYRHLSAEAFHLNYEPATRSPNSFGRSVVYLDEVPGIGDS